jgi:chemotaxis protein MotB
MDNKKVAQVAAAIKGAFQQLGVFTGSGSDNNSLPKEIIAIQGPGGSPAPPQIPLTTIGSLPAGIAAATGAMQISSTINPSKANDIDTVALKRQLEEALGDEIKKKKVQMRVGPDGLVVSLREIGFFDSGEAQLLPEAKPTITRLAKVLEQKDLEVRVEGHTDNIPIHTAKFNSNWELSTARATEVVLMLVHDYGFDPRGVSVAGYAEYRPLFPNDTEDGRRANRRIDLVVIGVKKIPSALDQKASGTKIP